MDKEYYVERGIEVIVQILTAEYALARQEVFARAADRVDRQDLLDELFYESGHGPDPLQLFDDWDLP